jgi:hypothetical protein
MRLLHRANGSIQHSHQHRGQSCRPMQEGLRTLPRYAEALESGSASDLPDAPGAAARRRARPRAGGCGPRLRTARSRPRPPPARSRSSLRCTRPTYCGRTAPSPDSSPGCAPGSASTATASPRRPATCRYGGKACRLPPIAASSRRRPCPGILAATVAELPELDGAKIATAAMHHREHGTIPHLLASHKRAEVSQR